MFIRLAAAVAALLTFQVITYFGSEKFQKNPHNVLTKIDDRIPFAPWTVLIYVLWFPLIVIFPLILFYASQKLFAIYMTAMVFDIVVSVAIYLIYPTSFERPATPDTLMGKCMKLVYTGSYRGLNCAPSLHCSSCMLIIVCSALLLAEGMESGDAVCMLAGIENAQAALSFIYMTCILSIIVAAGIVVSTMTTKQHAFTDFSTAIPMTLVSYLVGTAFPAMFIVNWIIK